MDRCKFKASLAIVSSTITRATQRFLSKNQTKQAAKPLCLFAQTNTLQLPFLYSFLVSSSIFPALVTRCLALVDAEMVISGRDVAYLVKSLLNLQV